MNAYYNEHDPFAAAWLRELVRDGLIAPGDVDERDVQLVQPADLRGYVQCHFFAGIGGWSLALRLAGWPDDRPVWTGSCPCQPFSAAGKREGFGDVRHLWPDWFRLIGECRPPVVFGEQVARAAGVGWIDAVSTDLEACGYAFGAADLPAACVGAPHIRQRLFFVADATGPRRERGQVSGGDSRPAAGGTRHVEPQRVLPPGGLADSERERDADDRRGTVTAAAAAVQGTGQERERVRPDAGQRADAVSPLAGVAQGDTRSEGSSRTQRQELRGTRRGSEGRAATEPSPLRPGRLGDPTDDGRECGRLQEHAAEQGPCGLQPDGSDPRRPWDGAVWIDCRDGKRRPVPAEPALFPLATGVPNRVGLIRGAGNAIVPQVAAEFIAAWIEVSA